MDHEVYEYEHAKLRTNYFICCNRTVY